MIPINDDYALGNEAHAWTIKKKRKDDWTTVAWYGTLDQALSGLYDMQLRDTELNSIGQLQSKAYTILNGIARALSPDIRALYAQQEKTE